MWFIYLDLAAYLIGRLHIGLSCMPSCESHNHLHCSGLNESVQIIGCLHSWGAYFRIGAYIRKELVRMEMGAYFHGEPLFKGCLLSQLYGIYACMLCVCVCVYASECMRE